MQIAEYESLGFKVGINVPATVKEFDTLAEEKDACLGCAIDHIVFHDTLGKFRSGFAKKLEEVSGIARLKKSVGKNSTGKELFEWEETESKYVARVFATEGHSRDKYAAIAVDIAAGLKFDPKTAPKGAGGTKIPKSITEFVAKANRDGKLAVLAANLAKKTGQSFDHGNVEDVAKVLHQHDLAEKRAEAARRQNALMNA